MGPARQGRTCTYKHTFYHIRVSTLHICHCLPGPALGCRCPGKKTCVLGSGQATKSAHLTSLMFSIQAGRLASSSGSIWGVACAAMYAARYGHSCVKTARCTKKKTCHWGTGHVSHTCRVRRGGRVGRRRTHVDPVDPFEVCKRAAHIVRCLYAALMITLHARNHGLS